MLWLDAMLVAAAVAVAAALRPWRTLGGALPPWPWIAWSLALPLLWTADRTAAVPAAQPMSGACLLVMMAGWPLAVLAMLPAAAAATVLGHLDAAEALHRLAWFGVVPATFALALGAAIRHGLPRQPFVYILGRGFLATVLAEAGAGALAAQLRDAAGGLAPGDVALARTLMAFGDAFICGMLVAIFVAFRPHWLATYTDRLYLPPPPPP
jgi:uncharacterized membrane protein